MCEYVCGGMGGDYLCMEFFLSLFFYLCPIGQHSLVLFLLFFYYFIQTLYLLHNLKSFHYCYHYLHRFFSISAFFLKHHIPLFFPLHFTLTSTTSPPTHHSPTPSLSHITTYSKKPHTLYTTTSTHFDLCLSL